MADNDKVHTIEIKAEKCHGLDINFSMSTDKLIVDCTTDFDFHQTEGGVLYLFYKKPKIIKTVQKRQVAKKPQNINVSNCVGISIGAGIEIGGRSVGLDEFHDLLSRGGTISGSTFGRDNQGNLLGNGARICGLSVDGQSYDEADIVVEQEEKQLPTRHQFTLGKIKKIQVSGSTSHVVAPAALFHKKEVGFVVQDGAELVVQGKLDTKHVNVGLIGEEHSYLKLEV